VADSITEGEVGVAGALFPIGLSQKVAFSSIKRVYFIMCICDKRRHCLLSGPIQNFWSWIFLGAALSSAMSEIPAPQPKSVGPCNF